MKMKLAVELETGTTDAEQSFKLAGLLEATILQSVTTEDFENDAVEITGDDEILENRGFKVTVLINPPDPLYIYTQEIKKGDRFIIRNEPHRLRSGKPLSGLRLQCASSIPYSSVISSSVMSQSSCVTLRYQVPFPVRCHLSPCFASVIHSGRGAVVCVIPAVYQRSGAAVKRV